MKYILLTFSKGSSLKKIQIEQKITKILQDKKINDLMKYFLLLFKTDQK